MTVPVVLFLALSTVAILFQLALALGAPWGEYTLGGKFPGKLPSKMRIAALAQIVVLMLFGAIVLARSGLTFRALYPFSRTAIWFVAGFFVLGVLSRTPPTISSGNGRPTVWTQLTWVGTHQTAIPAQ